MLLQAAGHEIVGSPPTATRWSNCSRRNHGRRHHPRHPHAAGARRRSSRGRAVAGHAAGYGSVLPLPLAESHYLMRILEVGTKAIGYRLKEEVGSVDVLTDALDRMRSSEFVIDPLLAKRLVERPRGVKRGDGSRAVRGVELDVLRLMAEGSSNNGIAARAARHAEGRQGACREHFRQAQPVCRRRRTSPTRSRRSDLPEVPARRDVRPVLDVNW